MTAWIALSLHKCTGLISQPNLLNSSAFVNDYLVMNFVPPAGGVFRGSACCKSARVIFDCSCATGGMFGYFQRRPLMDLIAALASKVSRENWHCSFRPNPGLSNPQRRYLAPQKDRKPQF